MTLQNLMSFSDNLAVILLALYCLSTLKLFRSTLQSTPNKASLKCPSVRLSTKCFFDFDEIWHVRKGWWVMHDGMQYNLIQGQGQSHEPFKVENPPFSEAIFSAIYNWSWQLTTDS